MADSHAFDLVLVNEYLPDAECEDVLRLYRKEDAQTPGSSCNRARLRLSTSLGSRPWVAKDIVCKHCFRQIIEIVRESLLCDRKPILAA